MPCWQACIAGQKAKGLQERIPFGLPFAAALRPGLLPTVKSVDGNVLTGSGVEDLLWSPQMGTTTVIDFSERTRSNGRSDWFRCTACNEHFAQGLAKLRSSLI